MHVKQVRFQELLNDVHLDFYSKTNSLYFEIANILSIPSIYFTISSSFFVLL